MPLAGHAVSMLSAHVAMPAKVSAAGMRLGVSVCRTFCGRVRQRVVEQCARMPTLLGGGVPPVDGRKFRTSCPRFRARECRLADGRKPRGAARLIDNRKCRAKCLFPKQGASAKARPVFSAKCFFLCNLFPRILQAPAPGKATLGGRFLHPSTRRLPAQDARKAGLHSRKSHATTSARTHRSGESPCCAVPAEGNTVKYRPCSALQVKPFFGENAEIAQKSVK